VVVPVTVNVTEQGVQTHGTQETTSTQGNKPQQLGLVAFRSGEGSGTVQTGNAELVSVSPQTTVITEPGQGTQSQTSVSQLDILADRITKLERIIDTLLSGQRADLVHQIAALQQQVIINPTAVQERDRLLIQLQQISQPQPSQQGVTVNVYQAEQAETSQEQATESITASIQENLPQPLPTFSQVAGAITPEQQQALQQGGKLIDPLVEPVAWWIGEWSDPWKARAAQVLGSKWTDFTTAPTLDEGFRRLYGGTK
jgi:hypothetical protein